MRHVLAVAALACALALPRPAGAAGDATYGRLEGALELAPAVGVTAATYGARPALELRARYLSMAGVFVGYEEGFGARDPRRLVATGIEVRPLFFARWLKDAEIGNATLDLFVDSFALELGVFFAEPFPHRFGERMGLQASLGLELPLFGRAEGLFLTAHGGGRFADALAAADGDAGASRAAFVTFGLAWHELVDVAP